MCTLERPDDEPLGNQRLFESSYTMTEARADAMLTSLTESKEKWISKKQGAQVGSTSDDTNVISFPVPFNPS